MTEREREEKKIEEERGGEIRMKRFFPGVREKCEREEREKKERKKKERNKAEKRKEIGSGLFLYILSEGSGKK